MITTSQHWRWASGGLEECSRTVGVGRGWDEAAGCSGAPAMLLLKNGCSGCVTRGVGPKGRSFWVWSQLALSSAKFKLWEKEILRSRATENKKGLNTPWGKSELETIHWKLLWTFRFRTERIHVLRHFVYPRNYDFIHECVVCYKNNSMLKTVRSWLLNLEGIGLPINRLIHTVSTLSTALKDITWYMLHIQR